MIRADSGFCREAIMTWCEADGVDYVLGLAQNTRLKAMIAAEQGRLVGVRADEGTDPGVHGSPIRTLDSWSRERRVVAKAETGVRARTRGSLANRLGAEGCAAKP